MAARAWSAADFRRRCGDLRRAVVRAHVASDEEIARYWPGGAVNTETHRLGRWAFCYANLIRLLGRTEHRDADARVDAMVAAALTAAPLRVELTCGTFSVYPKSYHALRWLDTIDRSVRDVLFLAAAIQPESAEDLRALALAPVAESLGVRLWAWVITAGRSDAEPATLPFDEQTTPEPPDWTTALAPEDLLRLARAHAEVNGQRLRIIAEAFPSDTPLDSRLSLAGFLGTAAQEMGQRPADLLRRWSLGEVFAQAVTAAQAAREARESAERKSA